MAAVTTTWFGLVAGGAREDGQTLTEYALIIAVLSLGLVGSLTFLRNELDDFFSTVTDKF
jgi:Flp pilus assembly pilin Flp